MNNYDLAKEVLTFLGYCNNSIIDKIPSSLLSKLMTLAADSNQNYYIDPNKELEEQSISDEAKDLLALIYYKYASTDTEKEEIEKAWDDNEKIHQEYLSEKYNLDNLFSNNSNNLKESNEIVINNISKQPWYKNIKGIFKKDIE